MATDRLEAGDRIGPFDLPLGAALVRRYAEATLDDGPSVRDGRLVPPGLLAALSYRAQAAAMVELLPADVLRAARSGVHGRHELLVHRTVAPDARLRAFVETYSARPSGAGLRLTHHHVALDDHDDLVAEQWWTTVLLGTTAEPTGPGPPPDLLVAGEDAGAPLAEGEVWIDEVMARRYAEVSGDVSDHHFSVEAARRSGFDAPILHGLCTMALCVGVATRAVAGGDPERIRRVAVRFAAPMFLGRRLRVRLFAPHAGAFPLEAHRDDVAVIRNGLVELVG